ncbi:MAG: translocation/assembly module TamB domain-containing protein [Aestuariibacter sp.]
MISWLSIKRLIVYIALTILLLSGSLALVAFLPAGSKLLINLVNQQITPLQIEYKSGTWWDTLHLQQVTYRDSQIQLSARHINISVDVSCLLSKTLCIKQIASNSLDINLSSSTQNPSSGNHSSEFNLPIILQVEKMKLQRLRITESQNPSVEITQVQLHNLILQNRLDIAEVTLHSAVAQQSGTTATTTGGSSPLDSIPQWQYSPVKAFNIVMPFPITVSRFSLDSLQLQSNSPEISRLQVQDFAIETGKVAIHRMAANYQDKRLDGQLQLGKELITSMTLTANETLLADLPVNEIKLSSRGALDALRLNATLSYQHKQMADMQLQVDLTSPQLPVTSMLQWSKLPLQQLHPRLSYSSGDLKLHGNLQALHSEAHIRVAMPDLPDFVLDWQASGNRLAQTIKITQPEWQGVTSRIEGQLTIEEALQWQGKLILDSLQSQAFLPEISANLAGEVQQRVQWNGQHWQAELSDIDLAGEWLKEPLQVQGSASIKKDLSIEVPEFAITLGKNHFVFDGSVNAEQVVAGNSNLSIRDFQQIHPEFSGTLQSSAIWSGALSKPDIDAKLTASKLQFQQLQVADVDATAKIVWQDSAFGIALQAKQMLFKEYRLDEIQLTSSGHIGDHQIEFHAVGPDTHIRHQFMGSLSNGGWSGIWQSGNFTLPKTDIRLAEVQPQIKLNWLEMSADVSDHCWFQASEKLCFDKLFWDSESLHFALRGQQLKLTSLMPYFLATNKRPATQSELNFSLSGEWPLAGLPVATLDAAITPLKWSWPNQSREFIVQSVQLAAQSDLQGVQVQIAFDSQQLGTMNSDIQLNSDPNNRIAKSHWQVRQLDLRPWAEFIPALDELDGFINGDLQVNFRNDTLQALGEMRLSQGHVLLNQYETDISAIEQVIRLTESQADISGTFKMGDGTGQLAGYLRWKNDWHGELQLTGEKLVFKNNHSRLTGVFSPDIQLQFKPEKLAVQGTLIVPEALAKITQVPVSAVSPSSDTIIADRANNQQQPPIDIEIQLKLLVDPEQKNIVNIDAFGLTSSLRGDLDITLREQRLQALGDLSLVDGFYKAFGQQLLIKQGDILFAGPLEHPSLQISAIRDPQVTEDNVIAGIQVSGSAQQPQVEVFSTPDLPQPEALSYLLRGKALQSGSSGTQEDAALNVLLSYGLSKGENLFARAGDKLGLENFGVETQGQGDKTKVAVSGSVAPNIKVGYGVGFDSSSEVTVRYDLTKNLYLQAVSSVDSTLDIYYQLFFD